MSVFSMSAVLSAFLPVGDMTERKLLRATGRNSAIYGEAVSVLNREVALLLGGQLALKLLVLASSALRYSARFLSQQ